MRSFALRYTGEAKTRIRHLHPLLKQEVRLALEELQDDPYLGKPLQREFIGLRSLRVRNYRIIYKMDESKWRIDILTLGPRRVIYQDLIKK
ncbi:MAG: type II toxin-antitoxin system RelE/ParE family toxin [Deltaproteobacteria bacterium]|nr:type II toxin-antitoxin system RelE/ParE family toxin [Deltaproteobacteria bacterium]